MVFGRIHGVSTQHIGAGSASGMENTGRALQQSSAQRSSRAAAGSLVEEGRHARARKDISASPPPAQDEKPARQRGRGSKLSNLLHSLPFTRKKQAAPEPSVKADNTRKPADNSLLAKMMDERPTNLLREFAERPSREEVRHYQQNFDKVRQNILARIAQTSSAGESSGESRQTEASGSSRYYTPPLSPSSSGYLSAESLDLSDETPLDDDGEVDRLLREMTERQAGKSPKVFDPTLEPPRQEKFKPQLSTIREKSYEGVENAASSRTDAPSPGIRLNEKGRIAIDETTPPTLRHLLQETLAKGNPRFLAQADQQTERGEHRQMLLGGEGKLFALTRSANTFTAFHSSVPGTDKKALTHGNARYSIQMDDQDETVSIRTQHKRHPTDVATSSLPLPGRLHEGALTGIYRHPATAEHPQGEQVRLHDGKLHVLNEDLDVWQKQSDIAFNKLAAGADNRLYAVRDKHTLTNLTDNVNTRAFDGDITAFAVNKRGQAAVLTDKNERAQLYFMPSLDAPPAHVTLQLADPALALTRGSEHIDAQTIGMADKQFFVSDSEGKLFVGDYPPPGQHEQKMTPAPQPALEKAFSGHYRIDGFASDENGRLHALVKDNLKQTHACPLGADNQFTPGWNLTDALVLDNQLGLTHIQPMEQETVDLKYQGKLTLQEGALYYLDDLTQAWTKAEDGCAQLKKGSDGQAYLLKDGEVKKISINQHSNTLRQGTDNVFSLAHARNKPNVGNALLPEAKSDKATAMAVINPHKFLLLSAQGEIHFHQVKPDTRRSQHPVQVLPNIGINGEIKDIALDRRQNLYALTRQGDVFTLAKSQWQDPAGREQATWQMVPPPHGRRGEITDIRNDDSGNLLVSRGENNHRLTDTGWQSSDSAQQADRSPIAPRASDAVYNRLNTANKRLRLPGSGLTAQGAVMKGGFSGAESSAVQSKFSSRLSAHVFSPTLSIPRPVKNLAYAVQHQWQGREGLKPVYQMQSALIKQLEGTNVRKTGDASSTEDLRTRLERLDLGEAGKDLLTLLQRFRNELEESATQALTRLGQHKGIVKDSGELNEKFKPSALKSVAQSLNPNRSGHDLSKSLLHAWHSAPAAKDSKVEKLLSAFVDKQVAISHQKADVMLGRQRDPNDRNALLKSRIILDTLTLKDLHQLVDKAELLSGKAPDERQLRQLRQDITRLRDGQYNQNPIKQFTDMGFTSNALLEANYDGVKAFLNAFRKEDHGLNVTSRTVLQAGHQNELETKLLDTLKSMKTGDIISFDRNYGGGASSSYVFLLKNSPVPVVPGGGMTFNRAYGLSIARMDNSFYVEFNRRGDNVGNLSMSTGFNLLPTFLPQSIREKVSAIKINDHYDFMPDVRINGSIAGTMASGDQKGLSFMLTDDELPDFIQGLTQGTLNPTEFMQKGAQHLVRDGNKISFSLDISSSLEARAAVNLRPNVIDPSTSQASPPFPEMVTRAAAGIGGNLNILSAKHERSTAEGENAINKAYTDNRVRFFNRVDADAHAGINAGAIFPIEDGNAQDPNDLMTLFVGTTASASVSIDSSVNKMVDMTMKRAEPVIDADVTELAAQLGNHFKDSVSRQVLAALPEIKDIGEKLQILNNHFSAQEINSDERYAALNGVKSALLQHQLAQDGGMTLASASISTTYGNLSRLDNNGIIHSLRKFLDSSLPPSNSDRIKALMTSTPELSRAIESIKSLPGISATVNLELKEPLKQQLIEGIQQKKIEHQDIANLFNDRNNLRLSGIFFYQSAKKREGFDTPTLVFGGSSSASVSMSKNIGTIAFQYGRDQSVPHGFTLDGDIAKANPALADVMYQLKNEGMELKS
ncbi:AvrE-family type 3 secretion system effector [Brenneria sp. g21c3]|uniref:AvrE-family type 3 secretion system effector n=1 Tax=Brenneria sp. g21c3 TaxID=3093893 RepID=UPI002E9E2A84|nr:AvrE-family type 3 secretion system effector [Brenneria sp. g21c3]